MKDQVLAPKKYGAWIVANEKNQGRGGQGTMFHVYRDGDETRTCYALKRFTGNDRFRNQIHRWRREVEAGLRLSHHNLTRLICYDLDGPKPYLVTELCVGGDLSKPAILRGKTLIERLRFFRGICEGVAYAHGEGVVHRDLKPANIFLRADGTPVVGDFGLCFLGEEQDRVTQVEEAVGARFYMAPELESGRAERVDPSADVYSLGKVLYWLLAAREFAREQHHEPQYDLTRNQATSDFAVVYDLLDRMIVVDSAARLRDGAEVVRELEKVVQRIEARRRVFDLAGLPLCHLHHQELWVASFRPGSMVTLDFVDGTGLQVMGFGSHGLSLAAWGFISPNGGSEELVVLVRTDPGAWRRVQHTVSGRIGKVQAAGYQALTFDSGNQPAITFTVEEDVSGQGSAFVLTVSREGQKTLTAITDKIGLPRHSALAIGRNNQVAVYSGSESSRGGVQSETIVKDSTGLVRRSMPSQSNFCGPLAWDRQGRLHQAIVVSVPAGNQETRKLYYLSKETNGDWTETVVGPTQSGHISLALKPDGAPVIVGNASTTAEPKLVIYEQQVSGWQIHEIDLQPIAESLGLPSVETGYSKQLVFDERGAVHVSLFTDQGGHSGVLYLAFDQQWSVVESRYFPAQKFFGMGIDGTATIHLALR